VLGLPRAEAAARLSVGDIDFVLESKPSDWNVLASLDENAPFFVALRADRLGAPEEARSALLSLAWDRSGSFARREAARMLIELESAAVRAGSSEKDNLLASVGRYEREFPSDRGARALLGSARLSAGDPAGALSLFTAEDPAATGAERAVQALAAAAEDRRIVLSSYLYDAPVEAEYGRVLAAVAESASGFLGGGPQGPALERIARARFAVFRRSYAEALSFFRESISKGPDFVLAHPETLADLGKAFQYGGAADEGADLFESWASRSTLTDSSRFRLLFYAGRMRRSSGDTEAANRLFARALPSVPDDTQRDACLWYVLDGAAALSPVSAVPLLRKYVPLWKNADSFSDFLESYCGALVSGKYWRELVETFRLIRPAAEPEVVARYAYVIGRAVEEGYIGADRPLEMLGDGLLGNGSDKPRSRIAVARSFFRIAFESDAASFYYRALASAKLGESLDPVPAEAALNRFGADDSAAGPAVPPPASAKAETVHSPAVDFLLAFFDYGLGDGVYGYALYFLGELSADDLRSLSARFAQEGLPGDSIRTVGLLARRPGYALTRADMELMYPRAYPLEIRQAASRWGLSEDMLFGLVRIESAFMSSIVSRAGAEGLAQLMRPTAEDVARRIGKQVELRYLPEGGLDLSHPATNLALGAWYLSNLNERLKSPVLSLFAYNGGITRVRRWRSAQAGLPEDLFLETVPIKETREYASKVLASAAVYGYLYRNEPLARVVAGFFPATAQ